MHYLAIKESIKTGLETCPTFYKPVVRPCKS